MFRPFAALVFLSLCSATYSQEARGLELLPLANSVDDDRAIADAGRFLGDPENRPDLEKRQKDGVPPPDPHTDDGKATYRIDLGDDPERRRERAAARADIERAVAALKMASDEKAEQTALKDLEAQIRRLRASYPARGRASTVTYRWVELGAKELRLLDLDNAAENDPKRDAAWKTAQMNRDRATTLPRSDRPNDPRHRHLLQGALFFSRECRNPRLSAEERGRKKIEYFVLARNPEIDPDDPKMERQVSSVGIKHIVSLKLNKSDERSSLFVQLNEEGTKLLTALTGKIASRLEGENDAQVRRHLAIVIDGVAVACPTLISRIDNGRFAISGEFTERELEGFAGRLLPKK